MTKTKRIPTVRTMLREAQAAGARYDLQDNPAYLSGYLVAALAQALSDLGHEDVHDYMRTMTAKGVA